MQIEINVKPNASENKIIKKENGTYEVRVTASPVDGEANKAIIKMLSKHFRVGKSCIEIKKGLKSKIKTIEIFE